MYIKPKKLNKGDKVAIVSPSWGGPSIFPVVYENGLKELSSLGLEIIEFPTARMSDNDLYNKPELRAKDINDAFSNKEIKAIWCSIGGEDSIRILKYLDFKLIKKNPKIIIGYSDSSTFLTTLNQLGLVTFHGPSIMAGLSQLKELGENSKNNLIDLLFSNSQTYEYKPYSNYYNGYPDWTNKDNIGKLNPPIKNKGFNFLQGKGVVKGVLYGGCIEIFEFIKGTKYWPNKDFWNDKILFFETSECKPTPEQIKWILRNYAIQGVFDKISALLFGRARDYSEEENNELNRILLQVINHEFGYKDLTIVTNMDFGHTDPQWILPLGIKAQVDNENKTFKLVEKIFNE